MLVRSCTLGSQLARRRGLVGLMTGVRKDEINVVGPKSKIRRAKSRNDERGRTYISNLVRCRVVPEWS